MPRMVAIFGVVLAVLWAARFYPQVDSIFIPLNILTADVSASLLAAMGLREPPTAQMLAEFHVSVESQL